MATTADLEEGPERDRAGLLAPSAPGAVPASRLPERTLLDIFSATVLRCGERPAIDAPEGRLTYRQLAERGERLAARLRAAGIGPGDRVGVRISSGTTELYLAILGILHAGAAYVPVDADDSPSRAQEIWQRAGACAALHGGLELTTLGRATGARRALSPADDAWIIFTSGSTGAPKGVAISHRAAAAFVDGEAKLWAIDVEDRVLAGLSVAFDASIEEIWLAWRNGATLVPAPRSVVRAGSELGPWIRERGITVLSTVPTLAAMWDEHALASVRLLILGGEAAPQELSWRLSGGREVWNTYGPTEATVVSTATRIRPGEPITIGWPLEGWEVAVLDEDGEPVTVGEEGELVIGGLGLGRYLDSALDAERFAPSPALGWERAYRTGDIVRETVFGLEFVGRRDDQVKISGRRIELGEVDARLAAIPGVRCAVSAVRETAAGNKLLVGYFVGEADPGVVRRQVGEALPAGLAPVIVPLAEMPRGSSGKVDRQALPWPPPEAPGGPGVELAGTAGWLAGLWREQLGPQPIDSDSDFFALGGTSLAAAKLVSALRRRLPAAAVADVYNHRTLGGLAARLDELHPVGAATAEVPVGPRRLGPVAGQLMGLLALVAMTVPQWVLGLLAIDHWRGSGVGSAIGWGWLIGGYAILVSAPARSVIVIVARKLLLRGVAEGRYPRRSWLTCRIWFLERLAEQCRLDALAGTPWADRYARWCGHRIGAGARLGTLPPASSLVSIGAGATIEADVDMHGWWLDGNELVIGEITVGAGARVGTRASLMPSAQVGDGAEVEPGTVVDGPVTAGERWAGAPGRRVGTAGETWPAEAPPQPRRRRLWRAMYAASLMIDLVPLLAALPGIAVLLVFLPDRLSTVSLAREMITLSPLLALTFVISDALVVAIAVRGVSRLIRPGWQPDGGATGWALWFGEALMGGARDTLFPLYASVFTRPWLRLCGVRIGPDTELSTVVGANRLTSFAEMSFAADDVVIAGARARGGWLHVAPVEVGSRTFLGNGAILPDATTLGDDSLVGVLTVAPRTSAHGTSWLGSPALELPRRPTVADPARTTNPSFGLRVGRTLTELVRILLPATVSMVLGALIFLALVALGDSQGIWLMLGLAPGVLLAAGVVATLITIAIKWLVIGRYRPGNHPLWSFFVWRDEIVNSAQEQLAGSWLLDNALGTPLMPIYLRLMGATVGRDVWCETLTITEFDLAGLGEGAVVNRNAVVETHLFHDRVMQIGPASIGPGATLGPAAAMLPDTELGAGCSVGARSIVMRGEQLPAGTRWHGAPVGPA